MMCMTKRELLSIISIAEELSFKYLVGSSDQGFMP